MFPVVQEELIRAKTDIHRSSGGKSGYFQGRNVRESLNQLRVSLNRSLLLPKIDNENDEEVNVGEDDINQLRQQINELYSSCEGYFKDVSASEDCAPFYSVDETCDADMTSGDEVEKEEVTSEQTFSHLYHEDNIASTDNTKGIKSTFRDSISISSCCQSPILDEPPLSESPKIRNTQKKSMTISSSCLGSWKNVAESTTSSSNEHIRSSLKSSKVLPGPTQSLAASLQRGLQIIDYHQRNSALNKSSASFSFDHLTLTPCPEIDNIDSAMHTIQERPSSDEASTTSLLCASCLKKISSQDSNEVQDSLKSSIDVVENTKEVPKVCISGLIFTKVFLFLLLVSG